MCVSITVWMAISYRWKAFSRIFMYAIFPHKSYTCTRVEVNIIKAYSLKKKSYTCYTQTLCVFELVVEWNFTNSLVVLWNFSIFDFDFIKKNNTTNLALNTTTNHSSKIKIFTIQVMHSWVSDLNVKVVGHDSEKEKRSSEISSKSSDFSASSSSYGSTCDDSNKL